MKLKIVINNKLIDVSLNWSEEPMQVELVLFVRINSLACNLSTPENVGIVYQYH